MKPPASRHRFSRWLPGVAAACLGASPMLAGEGKAGPVAAPDAAPPTVEESHPFQLSGEFDVAESYVGATGVRREGRRDSLDEHNTFVHAVLTPRVPWGYLRLGVEWERYSFGLGDNAALPNTLQAVSLVLGLDANVSDSILVRIEAQPGIYGTFFNHLDSGDFNVPFVVGGTYIYSPDLQFILAVSLDLNRKYPVLPAAGVRWKVAPHLVLNAVLPTPRVEYEIGRSTTLYAGAEIKENNFRVDAHFGNDHRDHDASLNRALVTFSEIRAGAGLTQKLSPSLTLTAEGGCQPYREFDFHRTDARYHADGLAPYGQISLHGAF